MTRVFLPENFQKNNTPAVMVIFGGTGDLAQTKLLPALMNLFLHNALPDKFMIVGLSRKDWSDEKYQEYVKDSIFKKSKKYDLNKVSDFCKHIRYVSGSFIDLNSYEKIKITLQEFDNSINQCTNKLFYLAVPPEHYGEIFDYIHNSQIMKLCDSVDSWSRLLVEKPFGRDLKTAQALENELSELFSEDQIYRIDHYLAKDAIENIMSLRFANSIIGDSWNKEQIESIEINLFETKDVSNRGAFYDAIGTLRDVGQNHMLQIFALLMMNEVDLRNANVVRSARAEALQMLSNQLPNEILRGQYEGFTQITDVGDDSKTETFFQLRLILKNKKWDGVKVKFTAGKALNRNVNEAIITFKPTGPCYCDYTKDVHEHRNVLKMQFSPNQNISLSMWVKKHGFNFRLEEKEFTLTSENGDISSSPEAYEKVLFDCITGDQTRFVSSEEVKLSWQFITPILDKFADLPLLKYAIGSGGPDKN